METTWVARARAGDEAAYRYLYDRHVEAVHRLAWRMCRDADFARDLTQETFIRAFGALGEFREESRFSSWLHRITVRTALNELRRTNRHREGRAELDEDLVTDRAPRPLHFHLRDRLSEAMETLPEMYRTAVLLHDLEGWTHAEIADALDIEEGTSKARLSRARARLRELLGDDMKEHVG